jgi:DNA-binding transcriptional LysR family regulator
MEEYPMVLAMPADHRLATQPCIQWRDLHKEKLILITPRLQHSLYESFFDQCTKSGATPVIGQYANDIHSILWLISAGFGIAPTTATMATVKRPGLVFRDLPAGLPLIRLFFAWKASNPSPVLRSFLEMIGESNVVL